MVAVVDEEPFGDLVDGKAGRAGAGEGSTGDDAGAVLDDAAVVLVVVHGAGGVEREATWAADGVEVFEL